MRGKVYKKQRTVQTKFMVTLCLRDLLLKKPNLDTFVCVCLSCPFLWICGSHEIWQMCRSQAVVAHSARSQVAAALRSRAVVARRDCSRHRARSGSMEVVHWSLQVLLGFSEGIQWTTI